MRGRGKLPNVPKGSLKKRTKRKKSMGARAASAAMGFRPPGRQCHYRTLYSRHVHWAALGESSPQSAG